MQVQEKYFLKNTESKVTFLVCLQICFSLQQPVLQPPKPYEIHSDLTCTLQNLKRRESGKEEQKEKIKSKSTLTGREREKGKEHIMT